MVQSTLQSFSDAIARADHAVLLVARRRSRGIEPMMVRLGSAAEDGMIWLAIGSGAAVLDPPRRRRWLLAGAAAPVAIAANYPLKRLVRRSRPRLELPRLGIAPSEHSFPSAHAASSFAAASALGVVAPSARPPAFALATLIAVGRPYLGMHYPSDVIAGAALGLLLGRLAAPILRSPRFDEVSG